jgi:ribosomal protein S18 acetylase RimI-like enzyme
MTPAGRPSIRPYRPEDRARVREISFLTGYMGEPVDWLWRDPESFADLLTPWYTDREPESLFVAEREGSVVGYLLGCVDSRRSAQSTRAAVRSLLRRGVPLRPGVAGFFWRSVVDVLRDRGAPEEVLIDPRWPAHLHINLLPEARGRGAGAALIRSFVERLEALGIAGLHLGTFAENANAQGFFRAQGFTRRGEPRLVPGFRTREGARMHVQWMVRPLTRS